MKKVKILLIALMLILVGTLFGNVKAATNDKVTLGAKPQRPYSDDNGDGTVGNDIYRFLKGTDNLTKGYTIFKLYEQNDTASYNKIFYCLRGRVGFGATADSDVTTNIIEYTELGEMHTDANTIIQKYKEYKMQNSSQNGVDLNNKVAINGKQVNLYNAILWILDNSYLPKDNKENNYVAKEYREELLDKAGIAKNETVREKITDDDIEVIQQLALWFFANYDDTETISLSRKTGDKPALNVANYLSVATNKNSEDSDNNVFTQDDNGTTNTRLDSLNKLYTYFVMGAIEASETYGTSDNRTITQEKVEFDHDKELKIESVDYSGFVDTHKPNNHIYEYYYKIGPFSIKGNADARNKINATDIVVEDKDGNPISKYYTNNDDITNKVYEIIDEGGAPVTELARGQEYFIKLYKVYTKGFSQGGTIASNIPDSYKYNIDGVTLKISTTYSSSTATFYYRQNTDQPVVEIEKGNKTVGDEITTEKPKEFDLSLRKFITAIKRNNQNVSVDDRTPQLDVSKLNTVERNVKITTARYVHPKNALQVETGDKVVYTIRVYNEGEIAGYATEITDYLPDGLEFIPTSDSDINREYNWTTSTSSNGRTIITTDYLKNTEIKAYDPTKTSADGNEKWQKATEGGNSGLYYADVQVECKVVAVIGAENKNLKNVAEISKDSGEDRDSEPGNVYSDSIHQPGTEDNGYFPGEQDDDDFEDLLLKTKEFDLSLRKFITKVERVNKTTSEKEEIPITSRVPSIEIKGLKEGTSTTARYVHPKNTLSLKRGDIITYTIRVYNEGELAGYAKEVKDYLPEGLELTNDEENEKWTLNGTTLTTTALAEKELKGYDRNKTAESNEDGWQKASDDNTGLYYYDLTVVCKIKDDVQDGEILTNIAEISADESKPTDINDRDSQPNNFPDANKNNDYEGNGNEDGYFPGKQDDDDFERVTVEPNELFDLALRKYIVAVNGTEIEEENTRIPNIDTTPLKNTETTADYNHRKDPVEVEIGNTVTYRFSVYNEGEIDGYVYSIVDYLPAGLTFDAEANSNFIIYKESYSEGELTGKDYIYKIEGNKITITKANGEYLFELKAFDGSNLDNSNSVDVNFKVTASESSEDQILTNVATMTYGAKGSDQKDIDSSYTEFTEPSPDKLLEELPGYKGKDSNKDELGDSTYHYEGQQDDDDFEKLIIKGKPFDLSLRKFITEIKRNGKEVEIADRTPQINTETLINGTYDRDGKLEYTATYTHPKDAITVKNGDIITYTLRIYNEGERDGYATEVTDYIPEGLALILNHKTNFNNGWKLPEDLDNSKVIDLVGENGLYASEEDIKGLSLEDFENTESLSDVELVTGKVAITTNALDDELIKAFDEGKTDEEEGWQKADEGKGGLYYKDIQVTCMVIAENTYKETITNVAEISEDKDKDGKDVTDRDSTPDNKKDPYDKWQEDDDDYEPVELKYFDLALRKFITGVETNGNKEEVTTRVPNPSIGEDGKIKYEHDKDPVYVANNDIVTYTIRVYNEGTIAGYAEEITDDIPEGLEYLPENETNKKYGWVMIDENGEETEEVEKAEKIVTDYLSEAKGEESGRNNLINGFDISKGISTEEPLNPDYRDVEVAFRVIEPSTSDRIITNHAQISEDSDDDEDSIPDEWNEGEDDQDEEKVYVKYFDLSLLKWVTQTIVTVDGKTTTRETGFKPNTGKTETDGIRDNNDPEPVAKVEIDRKKLNKTTVKFVYKIRVTNEGEIAGYATEVTDFIPEGLEFVESDNTKYGWKKDGDGKVATRALETVLLQPGEYAEVEIVFRWKNGTNNLGLKTNVAEITEDYNENNSKDIDSVPDNKKDPYEKEQEDDDDFAEVILSIKTGVGPSYVLLITTIVGTLGIGIYLIKRYVLTY